MGSEATATVFGCALKVGISLVYFSDLDFHLILVRTFTSVVSPSPWTFRGCLPAGTIKLIAARIASVRPNGADSKTNRAEMMKDEASILLKFV